MQIDDVKKFKRLLLLLAADRGFVWVFQCFCLSWKIVRAEVMKLKIDIVLVLLAKKKKIWSMSQTEAKTKVLEFDNTILWIFLFQKRILELFLSTRPRFLNTIIRFYEFFISEKNSGTLPINKTKLLEFDNTILRIFIFQKKILQLSLSTRPSFLNTIMRLYDFLYFKKEFWYSRYQQDQASWIR